MYKKRCGVAGIYAVVDPGGGRQVVERLQSCDVRELLLEQAMDPVDGELPLGAKDMEVAGELEVLVLVARETAPLEVHHQ